MKTAQIVAKKSKLAAAVEKIAGMAKKLAAFESFQAESSKKSSQFMFICSRLFEVQICSVRRYLLQPR